MLGRELRREQRLGSPQLRPAAIEIPTCEEPLDNSPPKRQVHGLEVGPPDQHLGGLGFLTQPDVHLRQQRHTQVVVGLEPQECLYAAAARRLWSSALASSDAGNARAWSW